VWPLLAESGHSSITLSLASSLVSTKSCTCGLLSLAMADALFTLLHLYDILRLPFDTIPHP